MFVHVFRVVLYLKLGNFAQSFTICNQNKPLFQVMRAPKWKSRPEICTLMKGSLSNPLMDNITHDF